MMTSKQFKEQYGTNPSSEITDLDEIYNSVFYKNLKDLRSNHDPYLKQTPENLQQNTKIREFLLNKDNKTYIEKFLNLKMDNIAKHSKDVCSDAENAKIIARKKSLKDADISFINKIDSNGTYKDGVYKSKLVGQSYVGMLNKVEGLFITFVKKSVTSSKDKIELPNLEMIIPEKTVKESDTITFGIKELNEVDKELKKVDVSSDVTKNITKFSGTFEVTPHNVKFDKHITLKFNGSAKSDSSTIGLFIQKDSDVDRQLDKWKIVPYIKANKTANYDFSLRSFSFMFLGDIKNNIPLPLKEDPIIKSKLKPYEYIYPGLNFRAKCNNDACEVKKDKKDMIIPLEFKVPKCSVEELDDEYKDLMICSSCNKPGDFVVEALIKEIIIFRAHGEINYRLNTKNSKAIKDSYNSSGNELLIYGAGAKLEDYKFFKITIAQQICEPQESREEIEKKIAAGVIPVDKDGNPQGAIFDLGIDGGFTQFKLIIGKFKNNEGFTKKSFENHVGKALTLKGFQWKCIENEDDFLQELPNNDIAWIISWCGSEIKNANFVDEVIKFYNNKKNLLLWEDNDAKTGTHTVDILKKLYDIQLQGNDPGQQIMIASTDATQKLTFNENHELFHGIRKLYEGVTICYPDKKDTTPLKVVGTNSSGNPNIMCLDASEKHGRLVVDCGFTKLFENLWDTAGTARYVSNATCWLAGATYDYDQSTGYDDYRYE
jgi:hypothetical protein